MAGTLLHVTLAERALAVADLSQEVRSGISNCIDDFRLGAVLVDLPYYDRLWLTALRLARGQELTFGQWGETLHRQAPADLLVALLEGADDEAGQALALGALTHHAVDLVFHPEICRLMDQRAGDSQSNALHKYLEDQLDLHSHFDLLGHPGIGTPYARRMLMILPRRRWFQKIHELILALHGEAPSPASFVLWARNLALFGWLSSFPGAPWISTTAPDDPQIKSSALELTAQAIRRAATYLEAGAAYLAGQLDLAQFSARVPQLSLLDGKPPPAPPGKAIGRPGFRHH